MSNVSFHKLLKLAQDRNLDGKGGLAATIAKMCLADDSTLNKEELLLAFEILHELIDEVELEIRRYIADYLAPRSDVPAKLLEFLANDSIHVAYPILVNSIQLDDDFLVNLISRKQRGHHIAIAERKSLSVAVSNALVETKDDLVAGKLLENPGAVIEDRDMDILIERAVDHPDLQKKLLRRKDIPDSIAQRMYVWVGEAARQYIARNYNIPDDLLNASIYDAVAKAQQSEQSNALQAELGRDQDNDDTDGDLGNQLAERLYRVLMLEGKQAFIIDYAYQTQINMPVAEMIFDLSQVNTIAIACKAVGFNEAQFEDLLRRFLQEKYASFDDDLLKKAVRHFNKVGPSKAKLYLNNWRHSSSSIEVNNPKD